MPESSSSSSAIRPAGRSPLASVALLRLAVSSLVAKPTRAAILRLIERGFIAGDQQMLFIVGHMRSGSSMLVHVLANNREILGYGETHHQYMGSGDFPAVTWKILRSFKRFVPRERFVLDKCLHSANNVQCVLDHPGTRVILLIRRPDDTLRSILKLGHPNWPTWEATTGYYLDRLELVRQLKSTLPANRCSFLTYEELTTNTATALMQLTQALVLEKPLQSKYGMMWSTGRPGFGDSSEVIKVGRIVSPDRCPEDRGGGGTPPIPEQLMSAARAAYDACLRNGA